MRNGCCRKVHIRQPGIQSASGFDGFGVSLAPYVEHDLAKESQLFGAGLTRPCAVLDGTDRTGAPVLVY